MSLKKTAVAGVKWTTASTLFISALQFIQLMVLARFLTPAEFGLMAMAMVVTGFAQAYADMGISAAIVHRQNLTREVLSSLYWLNIAAGFAVFFLLCLATPLAVFFFHEPLLYKLLPMVAFGLLISSAGQQFHWLLEKDLRFELLAKQDIAVSLLSVAVTIVSAVQGLGVWSLVWGLLAGSVLKTLLLLRSGWAQWPPLLHFRQADLKGFLSFGLYQMGERSINYFNSRIDQLLIGNLLGAQELGYYNFASNLVMQPVNVINPILTRVAFPVFARMQFDKPGMRSSYIKMMNLLCTINAPILFGLCAVAPLLIPLVFGAQWQPAIILVQVLAIYGFLRSTGNPVGSLLLANGRADLGFRWNLALFVITTPGIFIGEKLGGAQGVAYSLLVLMLFYSVANYHFLVKTLVGTCGKPYALAIIKPVMIAALMAMIVAALSLLGVISLQWLILQVAVGVFSYSLLLWLVDPGLIKNIKGLVKADETN